MRLSGDCVNFDTMLAGSPFSVVYVFTLHDGLDTVSDMLIARRLIAKSILFIGHVIVRKFSSVKFVLRTRTKGKGLVVCKCSEETLVSSAPFLFYFPSLITFRIRRQGCFGQ